MKYCTWKENGKSFIFEDGYIINPYNGDMNIWGNTFSIMEAKCLRTL